MTKRKIEYWVIPLQQDGKFVACMEEVLETYAKAYEPQQRVLGMDEQPFQLIQETRTRIGAMKQHGRRSITNTNAMARQAFFCLLNRHRVSDKRRPANDEPKSTGQSKWLDCWIRIIRIVLR